MTSWRSKSVAAVFGIVLLCVTAAHAKCGPGTGVACEKFEENARQHGLLGAALGDSSQCTKHSLTSNKLETDTISGRVLKTVFIGEDDKVVLAQTFPAIPYMGSTVWRSPKYGVSGSWNDISVEFENALVKATAVDGRNRTQFTGVVDMFISEPNPAQVFFQGIGEYNWISRDFGETVKAFKAPGGIFNVAGNYIPNPKNSDYLMAIIPREDCIYGPDDASCVKDLYVSFDFGETWGNVTANSQKRIAGFWEANWACSIDDQGNYDKKTAAWYHGDNENKSDYIDKTILASVYEDLDHIHGIDKWQYDYDRNIHFVRSDDWFGSKHEKIFSCGNIMRKIGNLVYLVAPASCSLKDYRGKTQHGNKRSKELAVDDDHAHLYVSEDFGKTFKEVCLPIALNTRKFAMSKGDANGAIVTAIHDLRKKGQSAELAYAYTAGNEVSMMTLSLRNIYCDNNICELLKIEGVPGTFVANVLDMKIFDTSVVSYSNVHSKITFDGGASWQDIPAPTVYNHPSCKTCVPGTKDCRLNLHVEGLWHTGMDAIPPLYSHENAPGVIMAVGNIGRNFDPNPASLCTFMSRDGGHNWEQVLEGPAVYEIGDHGGIIVAAQHQSVGPTDEIYFTVDEGKCWQGPVQLDQAMNVDNIRVETNSASHIFSLQGTQCIPSNFTNSNANCKGKQLEKPHGVLINVDFMKLLDNFRVCDDSEYSEVSFTPGKCQLGGHYTFSRRNLDAFCFNGKQYKHACPFKKYCDCTAADFECEFGFKRNPLTKECVKIKRAATCWIENEGEYIPSATGLREIRADVCTLITPDKPKKHGGSDSIPVLPWDTDGNGHSVEEKSGGGGVSGVAGFFIFMIVSGLICAVGGFVWAKVLDDAMKAQITGTLESVYGTVAGLIQGKQAKSGFSDMRGGFEPLQEADVADTPETA